MLRFDKTHIKELKEYLYHSNIHDARLEHYQYDREHKTLGCMFYNPIYNNSINLLFENVAIVLLFNGNRWGDGDAVLSLTVEEDSLHASNFVQICGENYHDSLYLLFQMFSGEELHIIAKEISINIIKK